MKMPAKIVCVGFILLVIASCKREQEEAHAVPPVRPVLSMVVKPLGDRTIGFAGTIQPQYQTDRGFLVLGRLIARHVNVGDAVKAGKVLAQLDPLPYELAVRSRRSDLTKAQSQLANAVSAEARSSTLRSQDRVSQAEYDAKEQARAAAAALVQQAEANLDKAKEQERYTTIAADIDGVVTSVDAEVGQTVSPGKKVMTVARLDMLEAVVDIPEDVAGSLTVGSPFDVNLQTDTSTKVTGKVREIAPQADSATRTRRTRITLDQATDTFRLGATITAMPAAATAQNKFEIPHSALFERNGATQVWVVDPSTNTVRAVDVTIAKRGDRSIQISGGLPAGSRVVVAGVHKLIEGQAVKIDGGASP